MVMFVGLLLAVYRCKLINYDFTVYWNILANSDLGQSVGNQRLISWDPPRLNVEYPIHPRPAAFKNRMEWKDKIIVQTSPWGVVYMQESFQLDLLYDSAAALNYIENMTLICSICVSKRLYSSTPEVNKFSVKYKNKYELTQEQKEALIGIMLADGHLERSKPSHNSRFRVEHTYPEQESYVFSIKILFASLIKMEPTIIVRKADPRTGKVYKSIYIRTLMFPCLNFYHDLFYQGKIKIVPSNLQDLLTPRGLAHIIMGDGFIYNDVIWLCTESFTKSEQELIITVLESKFGIKAAVNKRISSTGVIGYRIRVSKKSRNKLIKVVLPYFIPEMLYKLGIDK